jgi:hypothetical protein
MSETQTCSYDCERALTLARSGDYEDWQAICRKMLFDGWGVDIFNESAFTYELDRVCETARAVRLLLRFVNEVEREAPRDAVLIDLEAVKLPPTGVRPVAAQSKRLGQCSRCSVLNIAPLTFGLWLPHRWQACDGPTTERRFALPPKGETHVRFTGRKPENLLRLRGDLRRQRRVRSPPP